METRKGDGFWKQANQKISKFIGDPEADSVAKNPLKPGDCNPLSVSKLGHKLKV